jgi:pyruvate dehydrogenase E1 component alpha subunit
MREVGYRTAEEVNVWKARCPITLFQQRLLERKLADQAEIEVIEAEVKALVEEGVRFAEQSPWPDLATATDHLYSRGEGCPHA